MDKRYVIKKVAEGKSKGKYAVLFKDRNGKTVLTVSVHDTRPEAEAEVKLLELGASEL